MALQFKDIGPGTLPKQTACDSKQNNKKYPISSIVNANVFSECKSCCLTVEIWAGFGMVSGRPLKQLGEQN